MWRAVLYGDAAEDVRIGDVLAFHFRGRTDSSLRGRRESL
jgi:hypothetical protein